MKIKILLIDGTERDIDMMQYSVSVTGLKFENKEDFSDVIHFNSIEKILFDNGSAIMQMVDAIVSTCAISNDETGNKIEIDIFDANDIQGVGK